MKLQLPPTEKRTPLVVLELHGEGPNGLRSSFQTWVFWEDAPTPEAISMEIDKAFERLRQAIKEDFKS